MISYIEGKIILWKPTYVTVSVQGVGYLINLPLRVSQRCKPNDSVGFHTYLHVKEDQLSLYGFLSEQDKLIFETLISVNGIGPKLAQRILSEIEAIELVQYVLQENIPALQNLKGIGKKTAELMSIQLKGPFSKLELNIDAKPSLNTVEQEAIAALISLGLKENQATKAINKVKVNSNDLSTLISEALKQS